MSTVIINSNPTRDHSADTGRSLGRCALALLAAALHPRNHIRVYRICVCLGPFDIEARMGLAEQLVATGDTASPCRSCVGCWRCRWDLRGVLALPVKDAAALDAHN
jgi:hypothetical protein